MKTVMRKCNICQVEKPTTEFELMRVKKPNGKYWSNFRRQCRICRRAYHNKNRLDSYYEVRNNNFSWRWNQLKMTAKKQGVVNHFTQQQLKDFWRDNPTCYISGKNIWDHMTTYKTAYFLDRIGKVEHGGDGKKGGDYHPDNVRTCLIEYNRLRGLWDVSPQEMVLFIFCLKIYWKLERLKNKVITAFNKLKIFFKRGV